ncbi:MAG TPA: hypothetical protein VFA60_11045 [Terriglobales bacterium]|nr:hypothetical protein [Terriglobales bacterium]
MPATPKPGRRAIWLLLLIFFSVQAFAQPGEKLTSSPRPLAEEFQQMLRQRSCADDSYNDHDVKQISDSILKSQAAEVQVTMPEFSSAVKDSRLDARICAAVALFAVSARPDSATLLRDHLPDVARELNSPDQRIRSLALMTLGGLQPAPPPEVVPIWLAYLKRTDVDEYVQAGAVGAVIRVAAGDKSVITAVQGFWRRQLTEQSRVRVLNGLANIRSREVPADSRLVEIMIEGLQSEDRAVRFTAVQGIARMGKEPVRLAEPILRKLAEEAEPTQGDDVSRRTEAEIRDFARQALKLLESAPQRPRS